jgi:hypothetical protein
VVVLVVETAFVRLIVEAAARIVKTIKQIAETLFFK